MSVSCSVRGPCIASTDRCRVRRHLAASRSRGRGKPAVLPAVASIPVRGSRSCAAPTWAPVLGMSMADLEVARARCSLAEWHSHGDLAAFGFESHVAGAAFGRPIGGSACIQQDFDDRMPAGGRGVPFGRIHRDGQCGTGHRTGSPSRSSNGKSLVPRVKPLTTIPVRPAARDAANGTRAGPRTVSGMAITGGHRDARLSTPFLWRF